MCDVTGMDMWAPAVYPNASQPDGGGADARDAANCTTGCIFDILTDPSERHELSSTLEGAAAKARLLAALEEGEKTVIKTPQVPDDPACCTAAAQNHGGFLGPFK